ERVRRDVGHAAYRQGAGAEQVAEYIGRVGLRCLGLGGQGWIQVGERRVKSRRGRGKWRGGLGQRLRRFGRIARGRAGVWRRAGRQRVGRLGGWRGRGFYIGVRRLGNFRRRIGGRGGWMDGVRIGGREIGAFEQRTFEQGIGLGRRGLRGCRGGGGGRSHGCRGSGHGRVGVFGLERVWADGEFVARRQRHFLVARDGAAVDADAAHAAEVDQIAGAVADAQRGLDAADAAFV